jgi:hypothetical protein
MQIAMMYPQGLIAEEDLEEVSCRLREHGIAFHAKAVPPEPQMAVEQLVAPVILFLASDAGQSFLVSLAAAGTYDLVKRSVLHIWRHLTGKFLTVLSSRGATSRRPANMDLIVSIDDRSSVRIKLKSDLPVELHESCLTQALKLVSRTDLEKLRSEQIVIYDRDGDGFEAKMYSQHEFIMKLLKEKGQHVGGANSGSAAASPE